MNCCHRPLLVFLLLASQTLWASAPMPGKRVVPPNDAECLALPAPKAPYAFGSGEVLEFDVDAMGALAAKMTMKVLPARDGQLPIEVSVQTNTFFSKVRRVKGTGTSYLHPRTLRPRRYVEDTVENEVVRFADVSFRPKEKRASLEYRVGARNGHSELRTGSNDSLDVAGTIYLLRQLPLKEGMNVCFDVYGIRRIWRVWGKVEPKEHVSLKLGEFDAFHIAGQAVRLDDFGQYREIHVWISADPRRLPLAAVGVLDLGVVRASLSSVTRPGKAPARAEGNESLKW